VELYLHSNREQSRQVDMSESITNPVPQNTGADYRKIAAGLCWALHGSPILSSWFSLKPPVQEVERRVKGDGA
jgi:hypothetical protein